MVAGRESDDIEKWLNREFETPAEEALRKVTSDRRLTPDDWKRLIRFLAAQDVRTPAHLIEDLQRWDKLFPSSWRALCKKESASWSRQGNLVTRSHNWILIRMQIIFLFV